MVSYVTWLLWVCVCVPGWGEGTPPCLICREITRLLNVVKAGTVKNPTCCLWSCDHQRVPHKLPFSDADYKMCVCASETLCICAWKHVLPENLPLKLLLCLSIQTFFRALSRNSDICTWLQQWNTLTHKHTPTNQHPYQLLPRPKSDRFNRSVCEWFKAAVVLAERPFASIVENQTIEPGLMSPGYSLYLTKSCTRSSHAHTNAQTVS